MTNINEMELQTLRHLIMSHDTISCKLSDYSEDAKTPEIKQFFENASQSAEESKTKLMTFLK